MTVTIRMLVENRLKKSERIGNLSYYKLKNEKFPLAIDLGRLVNLGSDFFSDDILPDLTAEITNKIISGYIKYNMHTKYIYLSKWLSNSITLLDSNTKCEILREYIADKQYILNYHFLFWVISL